MPSLWLHLYVPGYLPESPSIVFSSFVPPFSDDEFESEKRSPHLRRSPRPRVLVVDDERIIADTVAAILNRSGFDAVACYGGAEAIRFVHENCPDIVLSDVVMPGTNGVQVATATRSHCPRTRILLISGNAATPNLLELSLPEGSSFELLAKPIHPLNLLKILRG
jgi:CheY-like chemotaxis protein